MPLAKATVERIEDLAARYPSKQSAIIPALWAAQHEQGYVTDAAMQEIAQHLGLPPSLIEATASFYSMFLTKPEGRHDMVICVNAPCMLRGADDIVAYVKQQLGVRDGGTTPDGAITWHSTIECLGACGGAPMMQVDHRFEENLTSARVDAIIDRLRREPAAHGTPAKKVEPAAPAHTATPATVKPSATLPPPPAAAGQPSASGTEPLRRKAPATKPPTADAEPPKRKPAAPRRKKSES
ncbi:MAG TPA: NAD(P)H-dependent oxidoreductase subunit E [Candidatus Acidoferrum sp.]|nr:NAD(P)H-dependent oxidoreductase subunit E [Candidatus Acidoferrum sp.]